MTIDEQGTVWLIGEVELFNGAELQEVLLRVEDGQPRVVHHIREGRIDDPYQSSYYTQLVSEGGVLYLAEAYGQRAILRLTPTETGFIEEQIVPTQCRTRKSERPEIGPGELDYDAAERLRSLGIEVGRKGLTLLPYHADLDTIVDHLIELVPSDGDLQLYYSERDEPDRAALERLPPSVRASPL